MKEKQNSCKPQRTAKGTSETPKAKCMGKKCARCRQLLARLDATDQ